MKLRASNRRRVRARSCFGGNSKPEERTMHEIIKTENHLPATESMSAWGEIAAEHGNQTLLKYIKGDWSIGEDEVPLGTKYIAFIDELACGFIKFNEDAAPDVMLGKVKFGKDKLPKRHDCGDVDQAEWEIGDDGKPVDPWQPIMQLPLSPVDHIGELVVFSAIGTDGACSAVADRTAQCMCRC